MDLCHDRIIMADTKKSYMTLNEALIDKVVPYQFLRIVSEMTSGHTARQFALANKIAAPQALRLNVVQDTYSTSDELVKQI